MHLLAAGGVGKRPSVLKDMVQWGKTLRKLETLSDPSRVGGEGLQQGGQPHDGQVRSPVPVLIPCFPRLPVFALC